MQTLYFFVILFYAFGLKEPGAAVSTPVQLYSGSKTLFDPDLPVSEPACPCFTAADLESWLQFEWTNGWWSDVPGCRTAPYEAMQEIWIPNAFGQGQYFDLNAQAGFMSGNPFASVSIYNRRTAGYDLLCGGYMSEYQMQSCQQILSAAIATLRKEKPANEYCQSMPVVL